MLASAYNVVGAANSFLKIYANSIPMYLKASEFAEQVGDKILQTTCLINLADDYIQLGDHKKAEDMLNESLTIAKRMGDQDNEAYALYELGFLNLETKNYDVAESALKNSIQTWEKINVTNFLPFALADLAKVYLAQQRADFALEHSQKAWEIAASLREKIYARLVMADAEKMSGALNQASKYLTEIIATLNDEQKYFYMQANAQKKLAYILISKEQTQQANELLNQALLTYQNLDDNQELDVSAEIAEIKKTLAEIDNMK